MLHYHRPPPPSTPHVESLDANWRRLDEVVERLVVRIAGRMATPPNVVRMHLAANGLGRIREAS